jgi:3D (Asp-Asp-Asp) domain-containing protein
MESQAIASNNIIPKKIWRKIIMSCIFLVVFEFICFPLPVLASQCDSDVANSDVADEPLVIDQMFTANSLPINSDLAITKTAFYEVTAYTSEIGQCDGDPCHTAMGFNLCTYNVEDTISANFLPFGAKIRMPELFGDRVFIVRDRMNSRFDDRIDVWFKDSHQAKHFGVKIAKVEILGEP